MTKGEDIVTIKLTKPQSWLLAKTLIVFTEDENIDNFLREFPDCDQDLLAKDIQYLMDQVVSAHKELNKKGE